MPNSNKIPYDEHLRVIKTCSHQYRIFELNPFLFDTTNTTKPKYKIVPVLCKSNSCKFCLSIKIRKLRKKLYNSKNFKSWRFFTLTSVNDSRPDAEKLQHLTNSFRKLSQRLRKDFRNLEYFYIIERSPNGFWHIHGLINHYIELKYLSSLWQRYSGAYRVNISKVQSGKGVVKYITNYLLKNGVNCPEKQIFYETNLRQYNSSRNFFQKQNYKSPYILHRPEPYTVEELKKEIFTLIKKERLYSSDISFMNYPFHLELLENIYYSIYCEPDEMELNYYS